MKKTALAFLAPYRARWQALEPRERLVASIFAGGMLLFLFYILLWSTMQSELSRLRVAVPQDKIKLSLMRVQASQVSQLRARGAQVRAQGINILATLEQTANARGLKQNITRMEPDGPTGAHINLEGIAFDVLVSWLNDLQTQNAIRVESATIEAQPAPGVVKARLTLRGPAA